MTLEERHKAILDLAGDRVIILNARIEASQCGASVEIGDLGKEALIRDCQLAGPFGMKFSKKIEIKEQTMKK